jgi:hypothetical protein
VAAQRPLKLEAVEMQLTEMKMQLQEIMESPLLTVQTTDPVKIFVLLTLDSMVLNGDVEAKQRKKDQQIR